MGYSPEYWGLDLECSGSDVNVAGAIQLGLASPVPFSSMFCYTTGGWSWIDQKEEADPRNRIAHWSEEAFNVHKIPMHKVDSSRKVASVDAMAAEWVMEETRTAEKRERIVVGWNVAGFDMAFVRRDYPKLAASLSYRSVDLNAILFSLVDNLKNPAGTQWTYTELKAFVKARATEHARYAIADGDNVGEANDLRAHNAGFDAMESLYSFYVLRDIIKHAKK